MRQPGKRRLRRATARHAASFVPWPLFFLRHSEGVSNPNPNPNPSPNQVPGPGMYWTPSAVSAQKSSEKHSYASWGFGTSTRADRSKIFISHAHAKTETGFIDSPGPCAYRQEA